MQITLQLQALPYGKLLSLVLPMVRQRVQLPEHALGKLAKALLEVPEEALSTVVEAIPPKKLDEVLAALVEEYQDPLLDRGEALLEAQGVELSLDALLLSRNLEAKLQLSKLDYGALAERFLPRLRGASVQDGPDGILSRLLKAPAFLAKGMVSAMPRETLDALAVQLVNRNADRICRKLEAMAASKGIPVELSGLRAEK